MENKFENRIWLSVEIDRLSYKLNEFNKIVSIICIVIVGLGAPSLAKDTDGESLVLLFIIPGLLVNILVWKLIRSVCVAITLLLSDSCNKDSNNESEE